MFAEVEMERTVLVPPESMKTAKHIERTLLRTLLKDFNTVGCSEEHGYYVTLTSLEGIGEGRLWERRACAAYPVRFRCVIFKPVRGEHVLAIVREAQDGGLWCDCGPIETFWVPKKYLEENGYTFVHTQANSHWLKTSSSSSGVSAVRRGTVIQAKIQGVKWEPAKRVFTVIAMLSGGVLVVDERWPVRPEAPKSKRAGAPVQEGGNVATDTPWDNDDGDNDNECAGWD